MNICDFQILLRWSMIIIMISHDTRIEIELIRKLFINVKGTIGNNDK